LICPFSGCSICFLKNSSEGGKTPISTLKDHLKKTKTHQVSRVISNQWKLDLEKEVKEVKEVTVEHKVSHKKMTDQEKTQKKELKQSQQDANEQKKLDINKKSLKKRENTTLIFSTHLSGGTMKDIAIAMRNVAKEFTDMEMMDLIPQSCILWAMQSVTSHSKNGVQMWKQGKVWEFKVKPANKLSVEELKDIAISVIENQSNMMIINRKFPDPETCTTPTCSHL
jgi:hypothetical protein